MLCGEQLWQVWLRLACSGSGAVCPGGSEPGHQKAPWWPLHRGLSAPARLSFPRGLSLEDSVQ